MTLWLTTLFFLTALLYASVGFGGGSTYLALLVIANFPYQHMPKVALVCNLIVVTGGLYHYYYSGLISLRKIMPFVILSVPMAFLGGRISLPKEPFLILLGASLACAAIRMFIGHSTVNCESPKKQYLNHPGQLLTGGILGFVSGLVGIGGGIFLAPLLYLTKWGNAREIAAAASFFIFVNSLSGLFGQITKNNFLNMELAPLIYLSLAVFAGGQIGSHLSISRLSLIHLQRLTAVFMLYASGQIFWGFI